MQNKLPLISTDTVFEQFSDHVSDDFNERILFSGPFGSGKSTFLKSFFEKKNEFIVLKLFPVNYSISTNEDVFELIKYDLLYELMSNYPDIINLKKEEYSALLVSQMFLLHEAKIAGPLKLLSKAGDLLGSGEGVLSDTLEYTLNTFKSFYKYKSTIDPSEFSLLFGYVQEFEGKQGHIYENDERTKLIITLLERIKAAKASEDLDSKVKTVLLIDDLDRLDPEHVFRLFNIFSAHYDDLSERNKFGFDKIIFVCDINNIQQLFNHRYGINVEFNGYIDKFYSSEVFRFDVNKFLKENLKPILSTKNALNKYTPGGFPEPLNDIYMINNDAVFFRLLVTILNGLIDNNEVRLRTFHRLKELMVPSIVLDNQKGGEHSFNYPMIAILWNLERLFVRSSDFRDALKRLYESFAANYTVSTSYRQDHFQYYYNAIIEYSLPFMIPSDLMFRNAYERDKTYVEESFNEFHKPLFIYYTIKEHIYSSHKSIRLIKCSNDFVDDGSSNVPAIARPNPFWFLYRAYVEMKSSRIF